ncbi:MAG: HPr(Ser) kinase/phosphatase [Betaproteobacteria bacterium]|nr:MAG: HPr(Ser) kinase/phosphatase [Betaproteobacteria bacterium]
MEPVNTPLNTSLNAPLITAIKPRQTVADLFRLTEARLQLVWLAGAVGAERELGADTVYRPTLALLGHADMLEPGRLQVLGSTEMRLIASLGPEAQQQAIQALFSLDSAAIFIANAAEVPSLFLQYAEQTNTALIVAGVTTAAAVRGLNHQLSRSLAPYAVVHGVLMEVSGLGVLITGDPAIGKSELALELVSRGHRLVADDAVELHATSPETLEGRSPTLLRDFMEVRGLGLLNIRLMFGEAAVKHSLPLKLIVQLMPADAWDASNRFDMQADLCHILEIAVPKVRLPVAVGRNLAVLVEVAVRNYVLQQRGYNSGEDFARRQREQMVLEDD